MTDPARAPNFRRTVLFTIAGTLVPGLGLIAAARRIIGGVIASACSLTGLVRARHLRQRRPPGPARVRRRPGRAAPHRCGRVIVWPGLGRRGDRQPPQPARPGDTRPSGPRAASWSGCWPSPSPRRWPWRLDLLLRSGQPGRRGVQEREDSPRAPPDRPSPTTRAPQWPADSRRTRGPTSRGSTSCCSAATPDRDRDGHPHRHDHPGQHQHRDRQHHAVQPAAQHRPDAVPRRAPRCTATTRTDSPTATAATPSTSSTRCTRTCRPTCPRTSSARPTTSAPTRSSCRSARRWGSRSTTTC